VDKGVDTSIVRAALCWKAREDMGLCHAKIAYNEKLVPTNTLHLYISPLTLVNMYRIGWNENISCHPTISL